MKFKYFIKKDINKETVGIVTASSIIEAEMIAARTKKMSLSSFSKLFSVEEL
tara:strand:+ start:1145 stop:1300 length:156 start_codon:yes stop_codon:yes gene_type:complete